MIRYLMKNNFKLMLRNKWVLATMLLGPVLVIALLSSAFGDMMASFESADEVRTGYRISENSVFADYMEEIKSAGETAGILFENYPDGDVESLMEQNDLMGFLVFEKEGYTLYKSADDEVSGKTLEYFMEQVEKQMVQQTLNAMFPQEEQKEDTKEAQEEEAQKEEEQVEDTKETQEEETQEVRDLPIKKLAFMPAVDAKNYYGIIEVVYFTWLGIASLAGILSGEMKNGIGKRFQVTALSETKLYLAKWIPAVLATICEVTVTILLVTVLFGISWGNLPMTILVLLVTIMGSIAFGMLLWTIFRNLAVTVVALFTVVWFMGFFGGSFETYLFSSFSESVKSLSPIYHINRTLVEYSCMGKSDYTASSIFYMIGIMVVCSLLSVFISKVRKEGRA